MLKSMTGFGGREGMVSSCGKFSVELRSANHKFLEIVLHAPDGFLSLEDKIKKEIETKVRRGRVTCAVNIIGGTRSQVCINEELLKKYINTLKRIKEGLHLKEQLSMDTLVNLPGVLSLSEERIPVADIWPKLKALLNQALEDLVKARKKEGVALGNHLRSEAKNLYSGVERIQARFKKVIQEKVFKLATDEERNAFLRNSDITEEIERLVFHIRNLKSKLSSATPVGKELDFIAQEMQREANTLAAKSCDALISSRIVEIKSQIEKIREQVQNIE